MSKRCNNEDCLDCKLPRCVYDESRKPGYRRTRHNIKTNLGVHYTVANTIPIQAFPTKHGYEYFVFRPINNK